MAVKEEQDENHSRLLHSLLLERGAEPLELIDL